MEYSEIGSPSRDSNDRTVTSFAPTFCAFWRDRMAEVSIIREMHMGFVSVELKH